MKPVYVEFVQGDELIKLEWNDKKTGERKFRTRQKAYIHGGGAYPVPFKVDVDQLAGPYRPGFYLLAGDAFKLGDYEALELSDRTYKLMPIEDAVTALTALIKTPKAA